MDRHTLLSHTHTNVEIFYWTLLLSSVAVAVGNGCLWGESAAGNWFKSSIFGSLNNTQNVSACWNGSFWNSCHETQRVEFVRNVALPWPAAARTGLLGCHAGWVCVTLGHTPPAFWGSIIQRSQNATKVCQVPFFDQISRLYWNHSMQHRFMFECIVSLFVVCLFVLWMKSGKTLVTMFFKKTIKQGLLVFFYRFCIYLSIFLFSFFSLIFVSFIWPNVLRRGNSFYHFWVIDY